MHRADADDLDELGGVERIMREITQRISFGMGVPARERVDHPVLDKIRNAEFGPQRKLAGLAESQLGTVGSGNHYVNLMEDEEGRVWVGVHFGSRGFGHKTASGFLALAQGKEFDGRATEGEMDSPPVLLEIGSELGDSYVAAMELAGEYAYAGRDVVVARSSRSSAEPMHEVHNHHNFAWREEHLGRSYWVIRKGCTPARPGQEGFVGGSMGDESVILEGVGSDETRGVAVLDRPRRGPDDEPDAGRRPRPPPQAVVVHRPRLRAGVRIGGSLTAPRVCPDHPDARVKKVWVEEQLKPGVVDWPAVQERLREQGIVLVGGGADEAPEVYKRLPEVLAAHARFDPRQAHAAPARRRDGRSRRPGPVQGLRGSPTGGPLGLFAASPPALAGRGSLRRRTLPGPRCGLRARRRIGPARRDRDPHGGPRPTTPHQRRRGHPAPLGRYATPVSRTAICSCASIRRRYR